MNTFGIAKDGIDAFFNHQKNKQDKLFFLTAERREKKNHRTAIGLSKGQFLDAQTCDKQTHLIQTLTEMQLHFEQLNSDLVAEAKDNERELWDHRSQEYSTVLVAATIMISTLVACLGQGVLHEDSVKFPILSLIYSITTSLSTAFLFLCTVFCVEILERASSFMKNRTSAHKRSLERAIQRTQKTVEAIRGITVSDRDRVSDSDANVNGPHALTRDAACGTDGDDRGHIRRKYGRLSRRQDNSYSSSDNSSKSDNVSSSRSGSSSGSSNSGDSSARARTRNGTRRQISKLTEEELMEEYLDHEKKFQNFMIEREKLVESSMFSLSKKIRTAEDAANKQTFEEFWNASCRSLGLAAVIMFYLGSMFTIFANLTFMWCTYAFRYRSLYGGEVCFHTVFFTVGASSCLLIFLRTEKLDFGDTENRCCQGEGGESHFMATDNMEYSFAHIAWFDNIHRVLDSFSGALMAPFVSCRRRSEGYTAIGRPSRDVNVHFSVPPAYHVRRERAYQSYNDIDNDDDYDRAVTRNGARDCYEGEANQCWCRDDTTRRVSGGVIELTRNVRLQADDEDDDDEVPRAIPIPVSIAYEHSTTRVRL